MLPSLKWPTWALAATSLSMAAVPEINVTWQDLMIATSEFPRFFGDVPYIERPDPPKVLGVGWFAGHPGHIFRWDKIEPMQCGYNSTGTFKCVVDCEKCRPTCPCMFNYNHTEKAILALQERQTSLSHLLNGLNFTFEESLHEEKNGTHFRSYFFTQTVGGLRVDNTFVQLNMNENADNTTWFGPEPHTWQVYTGEFDQNITNATEPAESCTRFKARDTAEYAAMKQPDWERLYPASYYLTWTVQDGRLYLAWRVWFKMTEEEVGETFLVWVNAKNCSQVIAAAPSQMDPYVSSLENFQKEQTRLFKDRGLELRPGPPG